jgi:hypothetical protein
MRLTALLARSHRRLLQPSSKPDANPEDKEKAARQAVASTFRVTAAKL